MRPFVWVSNINKNDVVDWFIGLVPLTLTGANSLLAVTQNGKLRWYALATGVGAAFLFATMAL